ncbi:hypothetical protein Dimus_022461 [Dionaea muscipula]
MAEGLGDAMVSTMQASSLSWGAPPSRFQVSSSICVLPSMEEEDGASGQGLGGEYAARGQMHSVVNISPGEICSSSNIMPSSLEEAGAVMPVVAMNSSEGLVVVERVLVVTLSCVVSYILDFAYSR